LLAVRDLAVSYATPGGAARAVDGIGFDLDTGQLLALVGESGCGKTTLALALLRLLPEPPARIDAKSQVQYGNVDLLGLSAEELRRYRGGEIAYVFQDPGASLNPVMTIGAQVAEAVRLHRGLSRRASRGRAVELLASMGLPDAAARAKDYPHELSGGMKQRAMIAMALAGEPKVLIADEPTTALDVTIQAQILDLLAEIQHRLGMAILLITHNLGLVAEVADRVLVMYAGRLVEEAPVSSLFRRPAHPYSEGLLRATPNLHQPAARLPTIPGSVPDPLAWPTGCRFHPRCPHAWEECRRTEPDILALDAGQRARCWLVAHPERRA
jgi:oligopeptide/dipeptide ABC transporter ATP-binding protein